MCCRSSSCMLLNDTAAALLFFAPLPSAFCPAPPPVPCTAVTEVPLCLSRRVRGVSPACTQCHTRRRRESKPVRDDDATITRRQKCVLRPPPWPATSTCNPKGGAMEQKEAPRQPLSGAHSQAPGWEHGYDHDATARLINCHHSHELRSSWRFWHPSYACTAFPILRREPMYCIHASSLLLCTKHPMSGSRRC